MSVIKLNNILTIRRLYTWKPDVADFRDHIYTPRVAHNPPKVDIIGADTPIDDQGPLGSCTGNSSTAMIEIILKTVQLSRLMAVIAQISSCNWVTFGFSVPDYFESQDVATNGWVRFPTQADKMIGGHAVVAVGYDDTASTPFVWVRNSWVPDWGPQGILQDGSTLVYRSKPLDR